MDGRYLRQLSDLSRVCVSCSFRHLRKNDMILIYERMDQWRNRIRIYDMYDERIAIT